MTNVSDNVLPFLPRAQRESEKVQSEKHAEEKRAVSDRLRAKLMRQRLDDKPMIHKESDRIRVAKHLWRILNDMKAKGYKPERLLRDLRMGKEGDSTKQLRNYALPEDATLESRGTQIGTLTRKASLYLRIAEGAAKAMNDDTDLIVLRLFENTSYQVADDVPDEKIASMDQIRELLVRMAEAAIRRNDLGSYLKMLESDRIGWDIDGSFGNYRSVPPSFFFWDRAARHVSYLGCAPTVFLYEREVGPVTPIDGEAFQIDFDSEPDAVMEFMREGKPLPKKHRTPVSLSISREIWFGIAPMQRSYTWEPVFEKRLSFHIRGRSLHVSSYDPMIVHESKMRMSKMRDENIAHQLGWLHQFTLLPRCPGGASLSMSVSPHIDTSEWIGTEHVQRDALEDRWLIALDHFDGRSLSVDDDIDAAEGRYYRQVLQSREDRIARLLNSWKKP